MFVVGREVGKTFKLGLRGCGFKFQCRQAVTFFSLCSQRAVSSAPFEAMKNQDTAGVFLLRKTNQKTN